MCDVRSLWWMHLYYVQTYTEVCHSRVSRSTIFYFETIKYNVQNMLSTSNIEHKDTHTIRHYAIVRITNIPLHMKQCL